MNSKNIIIGLIALFIGVVLAIGILVLAILKGNDMWKWMKDKCCCVGSKKVEVAEDANNYGSINNDPYANQPALKALINSPFEENMRKIDEQYKKEKAEREREGKEWWDARAKEDQEEKLRREEKDMQFKLDFVNDHPSQITINTEGKIVYIGSEDNSRRGSQDSGCSDH